MKNRSSKFRPNAPKEITSYSSFVNVRKLLYTLIISKLAEHSWQYLPGVCLEISRQPARELLLLIPYLTAAK